MEIQQTRRLIKFIRHECWTTLTPRQQGQLEALEHMGRRSVGGLRMLYRIAIANYLYPECPFCKRPIAYQDDLTIDHITPKSKGGTDNIENLQPIHKECNSKKGDDMPENAKCDEIPVKKHRHRNNRDKRHKQRDVIKGRDAEELYNKCKRIDQIRVNKCRSAGGRGSHIG